MWKPTLPRVAQFLFLVFKITNICDQMHPSIIRHSDESPSRSRAASANLTCRILDMTFPFVYLGVLKSVVIIYQIYYPDDVNHDIQSRSVAPVLCFTSVILPLWQPNILFPGKTENHNPLKAVMICGSPRAELTHSSPGVVGVIVKLWFSNSYRTVFSLKFAPKLIPHTLPHGDSTLI